MVHVKSLKVLVDSRESVVKALRLLKRLRECL
jgi:hypothetical protein